MAGLIGSIKGIKVFVAEWWPQMCCSIDVGNLPWYSSLEESGYYTTLLRIPKKEGTYGSERVAIAMVLRGIMKMARMFDEGDESVNAGNLKYIGSSFGFFAFLFFNSFKLKNFNTLGHQGRVKY